MNSVTAFPTPQPPIPDARNMGPIGSAAIAPAGPSAPGFRHTGSKPNPAPEKEFTPLVRQFLDYLKLERHFSDYTVKSYGADLQQFGHYLGGEIGGAATATASKMTPAQVDEKKVKCEPSKYGM